jgi:hypothetical protein
LNFTEQSITAQQVTVRICFDCMGWHHVLYPEPASTPWKSINGFANACSATSPAPGSNNCRSTYQSYIVTETAEQLP